MLMAFPSLAWVSAQRYCRAETLPVGETGVATDKGDRAGGGSPGLHAMKWRKAGDTGQNGEASLDRREGKALSHHGAASAAPTEIIPCSQSGGCFLK
ncbi:hypothetical protein D6851_05160 [Altericroceibacterium spongiae]|uniref:Uncharacterized protein n=1 Tax=Altericroceibacterium spongiae TaxID=2320269 RepID=A0A420EPJ9_9SPHN|nr:hypothetical protein D6851_05160 [Altericroceibacterium spongiae]